MGNEFNKPAVTSENLEKAVEVVKEAYPNIDKTTAQYNNDLVDIIDMSNEEKEKTAQSLGLTTYELNAATEYLLNNRDRDGKAF